jgi:hypothetical protein
MFSEVSFCVIGLDSTYANKASPPTPRLAISITPVTFSLIVAVSITGTAAAGASTGGGSGATSVEGGSNFDKSAGGPTGVGLW